MKRAVLLQILAVWFVVSCSGAPTATDLPTETSVPTATPAPTATPSSQDLTALHSYLRRVHERILMEYSRCVDTNAALLSSAANRSFDADLLCEEPETGSWKLCSELALELSVVAPPPPAEEFHTALAEALALGEEAARSQEWFCETFFTFGQPAEGMWSRLASQVRGSAARRDRLRQLWATLGGEEAELAW